MLSVSNLESSALPYKDTILEFKLQARLFLLKDI